MVFGSKKLLPINKFSGIDLDSFSVCFQDTVPTKKEDNKMPIVTKDISKEDIEDSDFVIKNPKHTIQLRHPETEVKGKPLIDPRINSRKAWLFSAVLPGLGQYYNHSYLKIPIIYGLFLTTVLVVDFNQREYSKSFNAFKIRSNGGVSNDPDYGNLAIPDLPQLISTKDFYRRQRDLYVILTIGVWAINAIDAYVVSELKGFDVSNDLSIHIRPAILQNDFSSNRIGNSANLGGFVPGVKLSLNFH